MKNESLLIAFHGKKAVKTKYLSRVRQHRKADDIVSGQYWEETGDDGRFQGCAVGCTLHSNDHSAYEKELGIPQTLARLEDRLFEALWKFDREKARMWPERFLKAPRVGADLTMVWPKFAHWLLVDSQAGVVNFTKREKSKESINAVAALYARWIGGDKPKAEEWRAAAYAADAADAYAADAADAYAAYAAAADAADAARNKHYALMADKLIELMEAA